MIPAAVFALSFSTLLFEVSLSRWFAVAHWGHLQTMVIGIALFGSAVSGAVSVRRSRGPSRSGPLAQGRAPFPVLCVSCSVSLMGSFLLARLIPLDYLRLPFDRMQLLWLLLSYVCLSLPFFFSGLAACLAYVAEPEKSGRTAFAAMAGSGAGAAAAALLLPLAGEGMGAVAAALAALVPAAAAPALDPGRGRASWIAAGASVALIAAGVFGSAAAGSHALETAPSPYKTLPQLLMMPGSSVVSRSQSIWGSEEAVESPRIRFAPGLSLAFTGRLPPQTAVFVDGDGMTAISRLSGAEDAEYAKYTHAYAGYEAAGQSGRTCLVIQRGGGLAAVAAVASGASRISVVADSPEAARRAERAYGRWNVSAVADNPRSVAAASPERFGLVHVEDWGPSVPGMASLSIDALLTVDALRSYWRILEADGVLTVSRRLLIPPSDSPRVFASLLEALRREGVERPQDHLAVVRGIDSCTFLALRSPLDPAAAGRLRSWCGGMGFDLDWLPGIRREETNLYNRLEDPWFFDSYAALAGGAGSPAGGFLDTAPQGDDRPFPSRFVRWTRISGYLRAAGGGTYALLLSGELVAAAVLLEAVVLSALLLSAPFLIGALTRRLASRGAAAAQSGPLESRPRPGMVLVFAFVGFGYIFAEVAFLDALTVLFAAPLLSFAVVLGGMLVFSGLGGLAAGRLPPRALAPVLGASAALLALAAFALSPAVRALLPLPLALRAVLALLLLAVPSFALGIPFVLAVRGVQAPRWKSFAWALNGGASVTASAAAALIAMSVGIRALGLCAAAAYCAAAVSACPRPRPCVL